MGEIKALTVALQAFRDARDWQKFHSLRNLIVSLNLEAAELLELTQWKSDAEVEALPADPKAAEDLRDECADILLLLLLVADKAGKTPYPWQERRGLTVYQQALARGALLRPLGSVVYFLPPYVITPEQIDFLAEVASEGIDIATREAVSVSVPAGGPATFHDPG